MGTEGNASEYLGYLVDRIHTTVLATIGRDGYPHTCAVDMMHRDESGIYFLTARGKDLYRRLTENPHISLTGIKGEDTMSSVALSLVGDVVEVGPGYLDVLLKESRGGAGIPGRASERESLHVRHLSYRGIPLRAHGVQDTPRKRGVVRPLQEAHREGGVLLRGLLLRGFGVRHQRILRRVRDLSGGVPPVLHRRHRRAVPHQI